MMLYLEPVSELFDGAEGGEVELKLAAPGAGPFYLPTNLSSYCCCFYCCWKCNFPMIQCASLLVGLSAKISFNLHVSIGAPVIVTHDNIDHMYNVHTYFSVYPLK